jgi:exopolysaccharide biosynthesis polyprenyl glycosylphosphotransferase
LIRRRAWVLRAALMAVDAGLAIALLLVISALRFGSDTAIDWLRSVIPNFELMLLGWVLVWIAVLWSQGLYRQRARYTPRGEIVDVLRATAIFGALSLSLLFIFKLPDISRLLLVFVFPSLAVAAIATRVANRVFLAQLRVNGKNARFMLILGTGQQADAFADLVESHRELGLRVVGHLRADGEEGGSRGHQTRRGRQILGSLDLLEEILHTTIIDEVAICIPFSSWSLVDAAGRLCEEEGKIVRIPMHVLANGRVEELDGLPIYSVLRGPDRVVGLIAKRTLDIIGATLLLIALSPIFATLAFLIRRDSSGPIFFRQERVGLHGRPFQVVKFRTMVVDAEARLADLRHLNEIEGHAFKMSNDPRITGIGRWLRRTSLDELPQLWNVLVGEMSLVGPRPPLGDEVAGYDVWHRRRLSMKPGMTGLWQVRERRASDFDRWVEADLEYIDNWSLWLDFKIIARTVPAMLQGR